MRVGNKRYNHNKQNDIAIYIVKFSYDKIVHNYYKNSTGMCRNSYGII